MAKVDPEEFIQKVKESPASSHVKPHLEAAATQWIEVHGKGVYANQVTEAVRWAKEHADQVKTAQVVKTFKLPPSPDDLIRQEHLLEIFTPRVKRAREVLFGEDSSPFALREYPELLRLHMVEAWIKDVASEENPHTDPLFGGCACGNLGVFLSKRRKLMVRIRYLEYQSASPAGKITVKRVSVARHGDLSFLEKQSKDLAKATGFSESALVTWILADIQPTLDPVALEIWRHGPTPVPGTPEVRGGPFPEAPQRYWAKVQVNSFHFTRAQWAELRSQLRQYLGITKSKPLSEQDQRLLKIVDSLGGIPKYGEKGRFWQRIFQENRETFPKWRSSNGPRKMYGSIAERLKRGKLEPVKEAVDKAKEDIDSFKRLDAKFGVQ